MYKTDLHLHTTASDGTDSPEELVAKAAALGLEVISVTDHDTVEGIRQLQGMSHNGIKVVTGAEFSCRTDASSSFDCHILGYGFDIENEAVLRAIGHGREKRKNKFSERVVYLEERFGIKFSHDEREYLLSLNSVAKPHLARVIVEHGRAESVADAIDRYMKADDFPDGRIDAREAVLAIHSAGGRAVFAHPLGGEREAHLDKSELIRRVKALKNVGIDGLECFYSRYTAEEIEFLLSAADSHGLLISGGSDYHGENKTVTLGRLSADGGNIDTGRINVLDGMI